ncbi:Gfo/Idh/MocA family protein [Alicyclobacillus fodiniaquatilis]|uniref:Gfo/Idh/MocA family protein n=1 Tax=Alicyclobacillus fodiniaquatilis TaxID=1661150 RepID=A0ABW4JKZ9_9BACL
MRKLKLGFIGVGYMGQRAHLVNYAELARQGQCELVALAEPRPEMARLVAERYGVSNVYKDHLELLATQELDAVVAAQPYRRYPFIVPDILRAKVPLMTEKPICLTVAEGERLATLGEEMNTLHMVGYHKRSDPATEYAKTVVDEWKASGECGRLRYIRITTPPGEWTKAADTPVLSSEPYPEIEELEALPAMFDEVWGKRYDAFVNYYIHQVNLIRFFLQEPYRVTYGEKSQVLLVGESDSGVCVTLEMAPYQSSIDWHESVLVSFERGFIKVDLPAPLAYQQAGQVTIFRDNGKGVPITTRPSMPNRHAMRQQAMNFLAAVRGEQSAPCVAREAVEDLKIASDYIRMVSQL